MMFMPEGAEERDELRARVAELEEERNDLRAQKYSLQDKIAALETELSEVRHTSVDGLKARIAELEAEINTPEIIDFARAVQLEAAHQRQRWGTDQDAGKTTADWYWLLGYLGGKAMFNLLSGNIEKGLHHIITTAAACANWHLYVTGTDTRMRPGIAPPKEPKP